MKKAIAAAAALMIAASPVHAQVGREVRPFAEWGAEMVERVEAIDLAITIEDYEAARTGLEDVTIWLIEADPEPCYAGLWGVTIAFTSAAAVQMATLADAADQFGLLLGNNEFLLRIDAVKSEITNGPLLDC